MAMDLLYRFGGMKNKEIGELMGIDYSTVSQGRKRLKMKRATSKSLNTLISKVEDEVLLNSYLISSCLRAGIVFH